MRTRSPARRVRVRFLVEVVSGFSRTVAADTHCRRADCPNRPTVPRPSYNHEMKQAVLLVFLTATIVSAQTGPNEARAREIYKELVEINTTDTPAGNVT